MILLIGLAVGVDYSMFYLRRKMEERDAGRSSEAALEFAAATSGKAVLVSGLTVLIAMAGMFLAGNAVFTSFAVGTMLVVAVAMLGSVTVLPAVLSKLGDNVEKGRVPYHRPPAPPQPRRVARRGAGSSTARSPARSSPSIAAGGILVVLALPALNMHTINPGAAGLPHDLPIMQTYERIQAEFPGGPLPALVVVQAKDVTAPEVQKGIEELKARRPPARRAIARQPGQAGRDRHRSRCRATAPTTPPTPRSPRCATRRSRRRSARVAGTETNVTGMTAGSKDFNDTMTVRLPIVFAFVLGLAFLLLLVTFRSIVVPLKAIVLNLLSRRRRLRRAHVDLPGRPPRERARLRVASAGSRPGCRCSCS